MSQHLAKFAMQETRPRVSFGGGWEGFWVVTQNKSEEQELNLSRS